MNLKHRFLEFATGLLFGLGLIVSGMTDPAKVLGFLDLAGLWNPSLALVMGAALAVGLLAFRLVRGRSSSFLGLPLSLPSSTALTPRLAWGSVMFGVGWGLAGYCPGPALVSMAWGGGEAWVFGLSMLGGMAVYEGLERWRGRA